MAFINLSQLTKAVKGLVNKINLENYILSSKLGDLSDLDTTDKSSLVAAINEAMDSGGVSDYTQLTNKPQINSVTLSGNKSLSDLGIAAESSVPLAANVKPKMSGEAAVGSSTKYAREDHVHPIFYPESDEVGWSGEKISHINPNTVTEAVEAVYNVIPTKTSDLTNDSGFGTYSKPSGGIPASDLTSTVQTSLGKADTALQSVSMTDAEVDAAVEAAFGYTITNESPTLVSVQSSASAGETVTVTNISNIVLEIRIGTTSGGYDILHSMHSSPGAQNNFTMPDAQVFVSASSGGGSND